MSQEKAGNVSMENIYRLDGRVPVGKAIPFGLQHVLAMFVSNLAPITIIAGAAQPALSQQEIASLIQNAMFVAGIASMIQLFPIWKVGAKLPIIMGGEFHLCNHFIHHCRELWLSDRNRRRIGRRHL